LATYEARYIAPLYPRLMRRGLRIPLGNKSFSEQILTHITRRLNYHALSMDKTKDIPMRIVSRILGLMVILACALNVFAQESLFLDWPADQTSVTGDVSVRGNVNPTGLQSYFLETAPYSPTSTTAPRWTPVTLPTNTPVVNDVVGTWST